MQNNPAEAKNLLSIGEASEYLGVSIDTLRRWEKKERIEPYRSPGGHRYFRKEDLDDLFGKRYTRDEPTYRRSKTQKEQQSEITETAIVETPIKEIVEVKIQTAIIEPPPNNLTQLPEDKNLNKPPTIPPWKQINHEPFEIDEQTQAFAKNNSILSTDLDTNILNRPVNEVKVPENTSIRIIQNEAVLSSQEAYFRQQSTSILTPSDNYGPSNEVPSAKQSTSSNYYFGKTKQILEDLVNKNIIIYVSLTLGFIILAITWYVLWKNSQSVLSPVP